MKAAKVQDQFDEVVTPDVLERAVAAGRKRHSQGLYATTVHYLPKFKSLLVGFADQCAVVLPVKNYPELAELSTPELNRLSVGFGGSALCLESRDLHVSIAGLVSASQPLMAMASTVVAMRNGRSSSPQKARASQQNGLKGGRPRKSA